MIAVSYSGLLGRSPTIVSKVQKEITEQEYQELIKMSKHGNYEAPNQMTIGHSEFTEFESADGGIHKLIKKGLKEAEEGNTKPLDENWLFPGTPDKLEVKIEIPNPISPMHYKQGIETWDYIASQNMSYIQGNIIKYVTRYKHKNGLEDLKKAKAYLDKLIEIESNK